ncbi:GntR family transcriptional regulator [Enterovirga rhinocerotis]|uniref:DNA-binding GntR family transcriptional regulator n=1 Tax=Enterovirga rhinocerotis TaxID=1339210 RepID=A0A4R7C1E3_9HYPH|nr:GntR family transcriptional regulator [Enterovirga rhinocerotis]TDR90206.1 DNA-binding GntR family transcriptional regulator [Enterovirga rhinocerotis]
MFVMPEIVRSPSLAEKARQMIQEAIWSGELGPGVHLVEATLAEQFHISRGPFREALRTLAADGLVEFYPGRGAFVVDTTPEQMQDMIILRAMLGGMAARYVTAEADADLLQRLSASYSKMMIASEAGDERSFFDEHWRFYEILHRSANEFIYRSWKSLSGLINVYFRRMGREHLTQNLILRDIECFLKLFQAGDPDEAEAAVRSEMLRMGFVVLDKPIPRMLHSYVTRRVLEDGSLVAYDPVSDSVAGSELQTNKTNQNEETWGNDSTSADKSRSRRAG